MADTFRFDQFDMPDPADRVERSTAERKMQQEKFINELPKFSRQQQVARLGAEIDHSTNELEALRGRAGRENSSQLDAHETQVHEFINKIREYKTRVQQSLVQRRG